jgi:hypothetical protein
MGFIFSGLLRKAYVSVSTNNDCKFHELKQYCIYIYKYNIAFNDQVLSHLF